MTDNDGAVGKRSASTRLGEPHAPAASAAPRTHEQKVELYLKTIAWFTGIVAAAVIVNVIAAIAIGAAAGAHTGL